jgi:hypothetical protein
MITNEEAIRRLQNRDRYLQQKIEDKLVAGEQVRWFVYDREAIAIAIAAVQFVIETQEYEASQSSPR